MQIAPELFEQVKSALDVETAQTATGQRSQPRAVLNRRLTIIPCPQGLSGEAREPLAVPVRDVSRGGVGFLLPRRLPLDTQFVLLLPRPRPSLPIWAVPSVPISEPAAETTLAVLCSISYWQPVKVNLFALGARFDRLLGCAEIPVTNSQPRQVLIGALPEDLAVAGVISRLRAAS